MPYSLIRDKPKQYFGRFCKAMMVGGTLKGCQTIDKWLRKYNYIIEIIYFMILPNIWSFAILIEVKQDEPKELYSIRCQM